MALLDRCGLTARTLSASGRPAVVGHTPGIGDTPTVLIYGHYDVQPEGPLEAWSSPPFAPEVRAGRVFGRGVADNKGQHLAYLLAIHALLAVRGALPCGVTVLLDGEEETGSPTLPEIVSAHRDELAADVVLWSDGSVHPDGSPSLRLGCRGVMTFELRAFGASRPLHSGQWGGVVRNPAWELVRVIATLRSTEGKVAVDGFYDDVRAFSEGEQAAFSALPGDSRSILSALGLPADEREDDDSGSFFQRLALPSLTINSLFCDDGGDHRTVIPHVAVARCDVRLAADQRSERVAEAIRRHVARVAPEVEFCVTGGAMEPSRTLPEAPFMRAVQLGAEAGLGIRPHVVPAMRGSLPLYVFTDLLGLPCYGLPLANVDAANHAPNENLELARFHSGILASAGMLLALGG